MQIFFALLFFLQGGGEREVAILRALQREPARLPACLPASSLARARLHPLSPPPFPSVTQRSGSIPPLPLTVPFSAQPRRAGVDPVREGSP